MPAENWSPKFGGTDQNEDLIATLDSMAKELHELIKKRIIK